MKFFVPDRDDEAVEKFYSVMRTGLPDTTDDRIYRIRFRHDGNNYDFSVGTDVPRKFNGGPVLAILKGVSPKAYYVITPSRHGSNPIMVGPGPNTIVEFVDN